MKAAVLPAYGAPDKFVIRHIAAPVIKYGEILVRNHASSVNPVDAIIRSGKLKLVTGLFGDILIGSDFSGVVIESKTELFKTGDQVFGFVKALQGGAYAEELAVAADTAWLKPASYTYAEAAALPLAATTAWQGLVKDGNLHSRKHVLINGCTGGVGCAAVQFAKDAGVKVTGRCRAGNMDFARNELHCHEVLDYTVPLDGQQQYDLIFDAAGKLTLTDVDASLSSDGVFVTTRGNLDSPTGIFETARDLIFKKQMKLVRVNPEAGALKKIKELADNGRFRSYVADQFALEDIAEAHTMLEKGGFRGKVAIVI